MIWQERGSTRHPPKCCGTTADWATVPRLAAQLRPDLAILDLIPGHERVCWLALEALKAHADSSTVVARGLSQAPGVTAHRSERS